jgi:NAD(P)H-dependent flavin oxidoreductase YrpB (nitropropane dioxygenase family)
MVLVPEVIDAVAPTPVVAAGGIARGSQIAAALALGAEAVWMGSIWLTTTEAETTPVVQQKFVAASSSDTVRSRSLTGKPARMLRSAWTDAWDAPDAPPALQMPNQTLLTTAAQQRINRNARVEGSGARQLATYFVGQAVGSMNSVRPVRQVMHQLVTDYADAAERFAAMLER